MLAIWTVLAAHTCFRGTAVFALHAARTVDVFSGRRLEAAIAIRARTAIYAALFVMIMLMKPICTFWAARTVTGRAAIDTFCSHVFPLKN